MKVKNVMSQMPIHLASMKSQAAEYKGKTYRYVLLSLIDFSRFNCLTPLQRKLSSQVASKLDRIFVEHGPPERLHGDKGEEFKKEVIKVRIHSLYHVL